MAVPFPAQALGLGATWKVTSQLVVADVRATETRTYTLGAIEGDRARVRWTADTEWKTDPATHNSEFVILGATSSVVGELEVGLSDLLPANGKIEKTLTTIVKPDRSKQGLPPHQAKVTITLENASK
jgi:hypothetical protein